MPQRMLEISDEVLPEVAVGRGIIGNAVMPAFLRQPPLDGAVGRSRRPRALRRAGQDLLDAERTQGLADLAMLFVGYWPGRSL